MAHALDDEIDADVAGPLPAVDSLHVAHVQVAPQQVGVGDGDGHEIAAVDGHPGPLLRGALPGPLLVPALEADVPERERLHGRGLPGVGGTDEDDGTAEIDLDLAEPLEVPDDEPGQHPMRPDTPYCPSVVCPGCRAARSSWFTSSMMRA